MTEIILQGVYPPLPTFFDEQDELDISTYQRHIARLWEQGIRGFVVMGSNGEAVHLASAERAQVVEAAREAAGREALLVAGCGEQSTRATIRNCEQAARSGADVVLVLPPFYFKGRMNQQALLAHYRAIADASSLPLVIYNMPASTAGLDLDAATICLLAEHPNIIGVKDSAGNMAKLAQIVETVAGRRQRPFSVFAGSAGYFLPALKVGAVGAVAALANVFPREVSRVQQLFIEGKMAEAEALQAVLVAPNTAVTTQYSVPGLKAALELTVGYGGRPRSPLLPLTEQERTHLAEIFHHVLRSAEE